MRQATQHGLDFAISPDETPHTDQCCWIIHASWCPDPRRCGNLRMVDEGYFCWVHVPDHPQCALGVHAWDSEFKKCTRCPAEADPS